MSILQALTPFDSLKTGLKRAVIEIVAPADKVNPIVLLCYNPTEYQRAKANSFAEIAIPGLETPPIQYIRGEAEKLTVELLADTSGTLDDVRQRYTNPIRNLMNIDPELHAPPIVRLSWGPESFKGVVESVNLTFVLFTPDGTPLRAKIGLTLKEYRPVNVQVRQVEKHSPDVDKSYTVRRGDTLSGIAGALYKDPTQWRAIAQANGIVDPRELQPGVRLTVPALKKN
jgi:nucleoid-associated protein YgaU